MSLIGFSWRLGEEPAVKGEAGPIRKLTKDDFINVRHLILDRTLSGAESSLIPKKTRSRI